MKDVTEKNSEVYWYLFLNKSQYWRWVFRKDPVERDDGYIYIGKHSSRLLLENFADTVGNEHLKKQKCGRLLISKLQDFIDSTSVAYGLTIEEVQDAAQRLEIE